VLDSLKQQVKNQIQTAQLLQGELGKSMGMEAATADAVTKLRSELERKERRLCALQTKMHDHAGVRARVSAEEHPQKEPLVAVKFSLLSNPQKEWSEHKMLLERVRHLDETMQAVQAENLHLGSERELLEQQNKKLLTQLRLIDPTYETGLVGDDTTAETQAALNELLASRKQLGILQEELMNENGMLQKQIRMHGMVQQRMDSVWAELKSLKRPFENDNSDDILQRRLTVMHQECRRLALLAEELQFDVLRLSDQMELRSEHMLGLVDALGRSIDTFSAEKAEKLEQHSRTGDAWLVRQLEGTRADLKAGKDERLALKQQLSRLQAKLGSRDKKIVRLKTIANYLLSTVTSENFDGLKKELADLVKTKEPTVHDFVAPISSSESAF
jgi:hypothetical protein